MVAGAPDPDQALLQAQRLLQRVPLIDGHNDFPFMIRGLYSNNLDSDRLENFPIGQTDIARLERGMVGGQFWSAYVPCPKQPESAPDDPYLECLRQTLQQIDVIHRMIERYPKTFGLAQSTQDVWEVFRSGRIASLIAIEGLHQIANSPGVLRMMHRLGVRYATLTHTSNNQYCDSATDQPLHHGLSQIGNRMINEMNRVGMIMDLSHTSTFAQKAVIEASKAPVIFSHSACAALVPHPRNVTDETLHVLKKNRGLLMICFLRELVDPTGGANATCSQVVDHILHAGAQVGFDHVGIGSDFDGMLEGPEGLDDVSAFPELVAQLLQRGVAESDVEKIAGLNILRVMKEVEDVALQEQITHAADHLCDDIKPMWTAEQKEMLHIQGRKRGLAQVRGGS
ncbi:renal dipeptidase family [Aspergillus carlsbadensis]|nr:renal dipeptidase family [Aspergillus carlsbadensis]